HAPATGDCRIPTLEEIIASPSAEPVNGQVLKNGGAIQQAEAAPKAGGNTVGLILEHKFYGTDPAVGAEEAADLYETIKGLQPTWIHSDDHADKVVLMSFKYETEFAQFAGAPYDADGVELAGVVDSTTQDL